MCNPFQSCWISHKPCWHRVVLCVLSTITALLAETVKKYIHLQLRHHSSQSTRVEIRGNPVKSCIVPSWMACGPSYTFNVQLCAWLPLTDCAPQMHFVFLFSRFLATCALAVLSSSQGLSLLSQPPCTLISLSALLFLPPLLQPGQHCTSFQSLYF